MMSECGWLPEPCAWNIHSRILYRKVQIGNASAMVGRHCIACVAEHPVPYLVQESADWDFQCLRYASAMVGRQCIACVGD